MVVRVKGRMLAVALVSSGLTGSCDGGSVDPPPPRPCLEVAEGQRIRATATVTSDMLTIVLDQRDGWWREVSVTEVRGVAVVSVERSVGQITIVLTLSAPAPTSGSFTFAGRLQTVFGRNCAVRRSFEFSTDGQAVQIAGGEGGRRMVRGWA